MSVDGIEVFNVGSVSNPFPPDLRASYLWLAATDSELHWQRRGVAYDREKTIEMLRRVRHPAPDYIERFMRGQNVTRWHEYWPPGPDSAWRALLE